MIGEHFPGERFFVLPHPLVALAIGMILALAFMFDLAFYWLIVPVTAWFVFGCWAHMSISDDTKTSLFIGLFVVCVTTAILYA